MPVQNQIDDVVRSTTYNPVGSSGPFDVGFPIYDLTAIKVFLDDVEQLDWTTDGTASDGVYLDATVTPPSAVTGEVRIDGYSSPHRDENDQFDEGAGVPASQLNTIFNRVFASMREVFDRLGSVKRGAAGTVVMWGPDGFTDGGPDATDIANAQTNASAAAASAAAAATSESNAAASSQLIDFTWNFSSTVGGAPASGTLRLNNGALASVTEIRVSETAQEGVVSAILDLWDDSSLGAKGYLRLIDPTDPNNWAFYSISSTQTDNGSDRSFPVTYIASNGATWADGTLLVVDWTRNTDGLPLDLASTTDALTGTNASKLMTPDANAALWEEGGSVASASIMTIGAGKTFPVTGSATINQFTITTDKAGREFRLVFAGAATIAHSANISCIGNADVLAEAGDSAVFLSNGDGTVEMIDYVRKVPFVEYTFSNISGATDIFTQAHGLGRLPHTVQWFLENTFADLDYTPGDRVRLATTARDATGILNTRENTTDVKLYIGGVGLVLASWDGNSYTINMIRWRPVARVWKGPR